MPAELGKRIRIRKKMSRISNWLEHTHPRMKDVIRPINWSYSTEHPCLSNCITLYVSLTPWPIEYRNGGVVPYRDSVTILRLASMQYITKLAMLQSRKPRSSPPNYKIIYPKDALVRTVKVSYVHKIVLRGLCQNYSPIRPLWTNKYISIYSYLFALKPFKLTYMKKKLSSIWRLKNSWHAFHFPNHPPHIILGNEQCLKLLLGVCNT